MLKKQQVIDDLDDAIKAHLTHVVDAQLSYAEGDGQLNAAVQRFAKFLHHSRLFYEKAVVAIEDEFMTPGKT
jgi:hypothetical protein